MAVVAEVPSLIDRMVEKVVRGYQPDKIILFGSYAYGEPDDGSDVDLLIIKDDPRRHIDREVEVRLLLQDENGEIGLTLLVYSEAEVQKRLQMGDDFFEEITQQGEVLYDRQAGTGRRVV
jgi:predicted nucleotidyltransferase